MGSHLRRLCVAAILGIAASAILPTGRLLAQTTSTLRGDANADTVLSVSDVFYLINFVFAGGPSPVRACLGDANHDRFVTSADALYLLNYFFGTGPEPPQLEPCSSEEVVVSPSTLTFGTGGLVPCGTTAAAKTVMVTSNSTQTLSMAFTLAGGASSPYNVSGPDTLEPGGMITVTVTPKEIPATSSTVADGFADTLSIVAAGGAVNRTDIVELHQTAQGAVLSFNPTGLSFSASGSKAFTVENAGNLSASYTLARGGTNAGDWGVTPTTGTAVAGSDFGHTATFTRPLLGGNRSADVSISTSAVRCAPLPAPLTLTGN